MLLSVFQYTELIRGETKSAHLVSSFHTVLLIQAVTLQGSQDRKMIFHFNYLSTPPQDMIESFEALFLALR